MKAILGLLAMVVPLLGVELETSVGDTVQLYEVVFPSERVDRLDIYAFPMEIREGGVPIPTRVSSDETDIALVSHLATTVVVYSVRYELVRDVEPDSAIIVRRLGVRDITVQLGLIAGRSVFYDLVRSSSCPKEIAVEDTVLVGPNRGQPRCASYLPMPSWAGTATEALFDSVYTATKTDIDEYAATRRLREAREDSAQAAQEQAIMMR